MINGIHQKLLGNPTVSGKDLEIFFLESNENKISHYSISVQYYNGGPISILRKKKQQNFEKKSGKKKHTLIIYN